MMFFVVVCSVALPLGAGGAVGPMTANAGPGFRGTSVKSDLLIRFYLKCPEAGG